MHTRNGHMPYCNNLTNLLSIGATFCSTWKWANITGDARLCATSTADSEMQNN